MSAAIEAREVRRVYGGKAAVDGATLTLAEGRITCLLGPSGCGKSTLLRLIAGLEPVDGGEVAAEGRVLSAKGVHVAPEARDIGLVFQDYALFPHLTVLRNVEFGLRALPAKERRGRAIGELERVGLAPRAGAWPQALSGGEQQRVALARALARRPRAMLLDEPFSGLDGRLKTEVRDTTLRALREAGAAALIVTHDADEAMAMGDEIALMRDGRILQTGAPRECYLRPVSPESARLLGEVNVFEAALNNGRAATPFGLVFAAGRNGPVRVLARPEALVIGGEGQDARVTGVAFMGAISQVRVRRGELQALALVGDAETPTVGDQVRVRLDPAYCTVVPAG